MRKFNEKTFICAATDHDNTVDLYAEEEDPITKATSFASRYFDVLEECYNEGQRLDRKKRMREARRNR